MIAKKKQKTMRLSRVTRIFVVRCQRVHQSHRCYRSEIFTKRYQGVMWNIPKSFRMSPTCCLFFSFDCVMYKFRVSQRLLPHTCSTCKCFDDLKKHTRGDQGYRILALTGLLKCTMQPNHAGRIKPDASGHNFILLKHFPDGAFTD